MSFLSIKKYTQCLATVSSAFNKVDKGNNTPLRNTGKLVGTVVGTSLSVP